MVTSYVELIKSWESNSEAIASTLLSAQMVWSGRKYHVHHAPNICASINLIIMPDTSCRHDDEIYGSHELMC